MTSHVPDNALKIARPTRPELPVSTTRTGLGFLVVEVHFKPKMPPDPFMSHGKCSEANVMGVLGRSRQDWIRPLAALPP